MMMPGGCFVEERTDGRWIVAVEQFYFTYLYFKYKTYEYYTLLKQNLFWASLGILWVSKSIGHSLGIQTCFGASIGPLLGHSLGIQTCFGASIGG
jgi:hypothetical protein